MSRQGLRSGTSGSDHGQEDLDRTLPEAQGDWEVLSTMDIGGQGGEDFAESLVRKFENLEKKVRKMFDAEKKRREKQEAEKEKNLQKRLTTMEAGINQSLEVTTGITQALDKRNNSIKTQFGRIKAQQTRIMGRINAEEERREEITNINNEET